MKLNKCHIAPFIALLSFSLAGCAPHRQASRTISRTPDFCTVIPDSSNRIEMDLTFHIPSHYFSRRSRLVITPRLMQKDTVQEEYMPLIVDAPIYDKKLKRLKVLENHTDPQEARALKLKKTSSSFDLPYKATLQLPDKADQARLVAFVSTDGCGECSSVDTIEVAAISNPASLLKGDVLRKSMQLPYIEPEFVARPKLLKGSGIANLQFVINCSDINLSLGNNERELNDMLDKLSPILKDTLATLNFIRITGMASADGPLAFNTVLAQKRAAAARWWLIMQLDIPWKKRQNITASSQPIGWEPVLAAMTADGNPDSASVKNILREYAFANDDVQEHHIRSLSCWNSIKKNYLQKDRKVKYEYSYNIKGFTTDDELLDMYHKRPDAFNEEELLRVASLKKESEEQAEVYQTIIRRFPHSETAANNLAVLYLDAGKADEACKMLEQLPTRSPKIQNALAVSHTHAGNYEKSIELLQASDSPEARYNLGLLQARRRNFHEVYRLLRPFADVNTALVALSLNRTEETDTLLAALKDRSPIAEYARALTAARQKKHDKFYRHLGNACRDTALRQRAANEAEFLPYSREEAFQVLVNRQ